MIAEEVNTNLYLPNPSVRAGYGTWSIFKRSLTGLNSEFSFSQTSCLTKAEELSLPYYLPIAGRRIIGFIPFPRVLVLCETQLASSRIWTRIAVSISYDDNPYTTEKLMSWHFKRQPSKNQPITRENLGMNKKGKRYERNSVSFNTSTNSANRTNYIKSRIYKT